MDQVFKIVLTTTGIISTVISVVLYVAYIRWKADQLEKDGVKMAIKVDKVVGDLQVTVQQLTTMSVEQAATNKIMANLLADLVEKMEKLTELTHKHDIRLALIEKDKKEDKRESNDS